MNRSSSKYYLKNSETIDFLRKEASLRTFDLNDYNRNDSDFSYLYEPDTRIDNYKNASMPSLPFGFMMAGRGPISRPNQCGRVIGLRASKNHTEETMDPVIDSCNQLSCSLCFEKASTIKAINIYQHIKDIQDYLFTLGYPPASLVPKHYSFSPPNDASIWTLESIEKFKSQLKEWIDKYIEPVFIGAVIFPHQFRFADPDVREDLKHSNHIHVIAFGGKLLHFKEFEAKYGFRYEFLGYLNKKSDIVRCARYILTHTIYTQKLITRTSDWTSEQLDKMKKNNEWLTFLKGNPLPIPVKNVKESLHSRPAYFYSGALKPYNKRYRKVSVCKRFPKGIKVFSLKRGARDLIYNELIYNIVDGVNFCILDVRGRRKYYDFETFFMLSPLINENIEFEICKSKLKFSKLHREKKIISRIEFIKNLPALIDIKKLFRGSDI